MSRRTGGDLHRHERRRSKKRLLSRRMAEWVDDRFGAAHFASKALGKVFPDQFSFMFGELALYCFITLVLTGIYLTLFFVPSSSEVVYQGRYAPLDGQHVSAAYASAIHLSFDVRMGLLFRQIHHWAALVFAAAVVAHLCRIFFTGAFRRPRETTWISGVTLLLLVIVNGFAGYSLLDDLLSGTGLRIGYSIAESVPVVGHILAFWVWGGAYPGNKIISRLFIVHVLIVPAIIAGLIGMHVASVWRQTHTQFAGEGRSERNVVGSRMWPTYATRSIALMLGTFAVLGLLGGLFQINPVWLYGPYDPSTVTTSAQPDWYMGWLEGALRIFPSWEIRVGHYMVPNPFFPAVLLPGLTFLALYLWPFIEKLLTGDRREHHLLERPRDRPWRTGLGVGVFTFYTVLFIAGGDDVIAARLGVSVNAIVWGLRIAAISAPFLIGGLVWRWCSDLRRGESPDEEAVAELTPDEDEGRPSLVPQLAAAYAGEARADVAGAAGKVWHGTRRAAQTTAGLAVVAYLAGRLRRKKPG
jgi:ubiquinol-cytochrome c reductase cytochrome b subunit